MTISKLDAARRQLNQAIDLFFHTGDPIAIATLGYNALEITATLAERTNAPVWNDFEEAAQHFASTPQNVRAVFHHPRNFFKHADRDPDDVLDTFTDDDALHVLALSVIQFGEVAERSVEMWSLLIWFYATQDFKPVPAAMQEIVGEFASLRQLERSEQIAARPRLIAELRSRASASK